MFWLGTSCNESNHKTDVATDNDLLIKSDNDVQDDINDDPLNTDNTVSDPDITVDKDSPVDETPDTDTSVDCLDLRYNENTLKTNFPFKDKDGKLTFCRPGCDTPTETDPQCVKNIWEWDNWERYQEYLEAEKKDPDQEWERECYPWPCKLPDMKASTGGSLKTPCDRYISVNGYNASMGAVWTHGLSDGVAGMLMSGGAIEYDPVKDEFTKVGQAFGLLIYNKSRYVIGVFDSVPGNNPDYKSYVVSIVRKDGKYYYELIYDNKDHNAFFSRPPFVGKDWVLIQVCEGSDGSCDVKYAKSDKLEWHSLNVGKVQEGNIVDDRLSFILHDGTADRQIYYCDMSKYPSSFKDCTKVTREINPGEYELGHSPRIDEDDKTRLIYYSYDSSPATLVEVKFEEGKDPAYNDITVKHLTRPNKVKGNKMLYTSVYTDASLMACWYRFDKNKSYCPATHDWMLQDMSYPTFTEKWQIYKGNVSFTLRDWECYCKETGVCPFEE